jgi:preprotein translocase subunit YajC
MDITFLVELITTIGFPMAVCIALFWFIYQIYKKSEAREAELMEEIKENREINGKFAEIISKYSVELTEIKTDIKDIKDDIVIISEKMTQ